VHIDPVISAVSWVLPVCRNKRKEKRKRQFARQTHKSLAIRRGSFLGPHRGGFGGFVFWTYAEALRLGPRQIFQTLLDVTTTDTVTIENHQPEHSKTIYSSYAACLVPLLLGFQSTHIGSLSAPLRVPRPPKQHTPLSLSPTQQHEPSLKGIVQLASSYHLFLVVKPGPAGKVKRREVVASTPGLLHIGSAICVAHYCSFAFSSHQTGLTRHVILA
jgi:hypothetical protein